MKTMVIMMGIQGSGKSTFYHSQLADEFVHINLDSLKTSYQERMAIDQCIQNGQNYAVDNTNPTKEDRQRYITDAKDAGYRIVGWMAKALLIKTNCSSRVASILIHFLLGKSEALACIGMMLKK
jgi:predicted kinase